MHFVGCVRALDDTAQAAQQPVDQLARLQKVVDVWQQQAKNSQSELAASLSQIDALKANNIKLSGELTSAKATVFELTEDVSDKQQHIQELQSIVSSYKPPSMTEEEIESMRLENQEMKQELAHLKAVSVKDEGVIKAQSMDNESLRKKLESYKDQVEKLTENLNNLTSAHSEQVSSFEQKLLGQRNQLSSLRQENQQLRDKLSSSLDTLEQSSQHTISQISQHLTNKSITLEELEEAHRTLSRDYEQLRIDNRRLLDDLESTRTTQDESLSTVQQRMQTREEEIASLQQTIVNLKEQLLEAESKVKWDAAQLESELSEQYARDVKLLQQKHEADIATLHSEFDIKLQEAVALTARKALSKAEEEFHLQANTQVSELSVQHEQALIILRATYEDQISRLQSTIQQQRHEVEDLALTKGELAQSCATHTRHIASLESDIENLKRAHDEELRALVDSHRTSEEESKAQLETARSQYQYSLNAQIEGLKKSSDERFQVLTSKHELEVSRLQDQLRQAELSTDHEDEMLQMQTQWTEKFEKSLRAALEEQELTLLSAFESEKASIQAQTLKQLEREFNQRVATVNYEFQLERGSLQESFMTKLADKESEFNRKLEDISAAFDNKQNQSYEEWKSSQYQLVQALNSQHQVDLKRAYEQARSEVEAEWQGKLIEAEGIWASNNEALYKQAVRREVENNRAVWKNESDEVLSRSNKEWESKLQSITSSLRDNLRQQYDSEKALLTATAAESTAQVVELTTRVQALESELIQQSTANADKLAQLTSIWDKQLRSVTEEHTIKFESEKRELTNHIEEEHTEALIELESHLIDRFNTTKLEELESLRTTVTEHFERLLSEKNELVDNLQSKLLSTESALKRVQELDAASKDERALQYEQQIRQLNQAHTDAMVTRSVAYESDIRALRLELQSVQQDKERELQELKANHVRQMSTVREEFDAQLRNALAEKEAIYVQMTADQSESFQREKQLLQDQVNTQIRQLEQERLGFETRLQSDLQALESQWQVKLQRAEDRDKKTEDAKSISTISDADGRLLVAASESKLNSTGTTNPLAQLLTMIHEGDSQGIRTVVQAHGASLRASYWCDAMASASAYDTANSTHSVTLPLHSAITGLHIHGSEALLLSTLETLLQLEADVNQQDRAGDSVLHKFLQVCSSKSIVAVLTLLLRAGANPNLCNTRGESPLMLECLKLRSASCEVLRVLVQAGANVNISCRNSFNKSVPTGTNINKSSDALSPAQSGLTASTYYLSNELCERSALTVVLEQGLLSAQSVTEMLLSKSPRNEPFSQLSSIRQTTTQDAFTAASSFGRFSTLNSKASLIGTDFLSSTAHSQLDTAVKSKRRTKSVENSPHNASRKVWVSVLQLLLQSGASWSPVWRNDKHNSQLHLLTASFPPPRADLATYFEVVHRAVLAFLSVRPENVVSANNKGQSPLCVFCERLSIVPFDRYCDGIHDTLQFLISHISDPDGIFRRQNLFDQKHSDTFGMTRALEVGQSAQLNADASANISYLSLSDDSDSDSDNEHVKQTQIKDKLRVPAVQKAYTQKSIEMKRYNSSSLARGEPLLHQRSTATQTNRKYGAIVPSTQPNSDIPLSSRRFSSSAYPATSSRRQREQTALDTISPTSSSADSQPIDRRSANQLKIFSAAASRLSHMAAALKSKSTTTTATTATKYRETSTNQPQRSHSTSSLLNDIVVDALDASDTSIHASTAFFNIPTTSRM